MRLVPTESFSLIKPQSCLFLLGDHVFHPKIAQASQIEFQQNSIQTIMPQMKDNHCQASKHIYLRFGLAGVNICHVMLANLLQLAGSTSSLHIVVPILYMQVVLCYTLLSSQGGT